MKSKHLNIFECVTIANVSVIFTALVEGILGIDFPLFGYIAGGVWLAVLIITFPEAIAHFREWESRQS